MAPDPIPDFEKWGARVSEGAVAMKKAWPYLCLVLLGMALAQIVALTLTPDARRIVTGVPASIFNIDPRWTWAAVAVGFWFLSAGALGRQILSRVAIGIDSSAVAVPELRRANELLFLLGRLDPVDVANLEALIQAPEGITHTEPLGALCQKANHGIVRGTGGSLISISESYWPLLLKWHEGRLRAGPVKPQIVVPSVVNLELAYEFLEMLGGLDHDDLDALDELARAMPEGELPRVERFQKLKTKAPKIVDDSRMTNGRTWIAKPYHPAATAWIKARRKA